MPHALDRDGSPESIRRDSILHGYSGERLSEQGFLEMLRDSGIEFVEGFPLGHRTKLIRQVGVEALEVEPGATLELYSSLGVVAVFPGAGRQPPEALHPWMRLTHEHVLHQ